jgi:hypothetical protein
VDCGPPSCCCCCCCSCCMHYRLGKYCRAVARPPAAMAPTAPAIAAALGPRGDRNSAAVTNPVQAGDIVKHSNHCQRGSPASAVCTVHVATNCAAHVRTYTTWPASAQGHPPHTHTHQLDAPAATVLASSGSLASARWLRYDSLTAK